jgi:hypothetical protein
MYTDRWARVLTILYCDTCRDNVRERNDLTFDEGHLKQEGT